MQTLKARFSVVDDLLAEAQRGRLNDHGEFVIENSGRIGPLVELLSATTNHPGDYQAVSLAGSFANRLKHSWATGASFGGNVGDMAGAFPQPSDNPVLTRDPHWEQWLLHAENVAKVNGVPAPLVASLIGAMCEMQDNVYEHSGAPRTGLVAYAVTDRSFEFVVADRGIGVLETLRQNHEYTHLPDAGGGVNASDQTGSVKIPGGERKGSRVCATVSVDGDAPGGASLSQWRSCADAMPDGRSSRCTPAAHSYFRPLRLDD